MIHNYCIIMAGGIGSRFWPMSRKKYPKQFHDVLGTGYSLIQLTYNRVVHVCPPENILVVTNIEYNELVLEQLPELSAQQVLSEPYMRNTAPCIAYASYKVFSKDQDAKIIIVPSDHLVLQEDAYFQTLRTALKQAEIKDCLVTLGIRPSRPDTGYGYIQFHDEKDTVSKTVKKVKTFTEKPDIVLAEQFLKSGDFYWNSGMFIWTAKSILQAFKTLLPEIDELFDAGMDKYYTDQESSYINKIYLECPNLSIDYGLMEKADNVYVVLADFGWSDIGTWGSLATHIKKDNNENSIIGDKVMSYDSTGNIVYTPKDKLVVLQGLEDYIVVDSGNVLMICKKEAEQKIKQIVGDIKDKKLGEYT